MMMIEVTEDKMGKLSEHIEQSLKHLGKAMTCVEEWMQESEMGQRGSYGNRGGQGGYGSRYSNSSYGSRYGMRGGYEDWDEMDDDMGERRRRSRTTGRYM